MTTIDGLALRRRIALARGWAEGETHVGQGDMAMVWQSPGLRIAHPNDFFYCEPLPAWDSDPSAALTLWAELVAARKPLALPSFTETLVGSAAADGGGIVIYVNATDEPDPVRRFCLALCQLWLSWHESKVAA